MATGEVKFFEKIKINSSLGVFQRLFGVWNGYINEVLHITFWPIFLLYSENSLLLWTTILLHKDAEQDVSRH